MLNLQFLILKRRVINFTNPWKIEKSTPAWALRSISYTSSTASEAEVKKLKENNIDITEGIDFKRKTTDNRGQLFESILFHPYIIVNGEIRKIDELIVDKDDTFSPSYKSNRDFAVNSVLREGSGKWYKLKITKDGVYELTYEYLQGLGIDVANLNPSHLNIFGNGTGVLNENNSAYRPDDLIKNAIDLIGGDDNSFDPGDKFIFYAKGPNRWDRVGSLFKRQMHYYSDYSAYFININANDTPLRVSNAQLSINNPTHTVNSFDDYAIHEEETESLTNGGKRWYGEKFDVELNQNFGFNFPNIVSFEPAKLSYAFAYNTGDNSSKFVVSANNSGVDTIILNPFSTQGALYTRKVRSVVNGNFQPTNASFTINCNFQRNTPSIQLYLDYIEINLRRELKASESQMDFRDINSVGTGNTALFQLENYGNNRTVWEVTDPTKPKLVTGQISGNTLNFTVDSDSLRQFICYNQNFLEPEYIGTISNQNLHGLEYADNLIITHPLFLAQAKRLAQLHQEEGVSSHVVLLPQVYNEFSGGAPDATAIKSFARMFFDRANGDVNLMPKYLTLFGDGSFDPKNRIADNNNMIPTYQVLESENIISNLVSDDYFGILGDFESFGNNDDLDIGVGRLIVSTELQAKQMVDKIEHYMKNGSTLFAGTSSNCNDDGFSSTEGDWRLSYALIADDKDGTNDDFMQFDTEPSYNYVKANHSEMNANKIYLDALNQQTTAGGERYPEANEAIDRNFNKGNIVMAYIGHGGEAGAAQERIITINQINELKNIDRLPLFVSATCEFTKYDDAERLSAGEYMYLNPNGGAIALMTTTRSVYISVNTQTNQAFFQNVFVKNSDGSAKTFGEIIRNSKNDVVGGNSNKRSFTLIGDPALRIALPQHKVVIDSINGYDVTQYADTLRALSTANISGHIEDINGNPLNYNGVVINSIFDKEKEYVTLGNDLGTPFDYQLQINKLYKGKSTVSNGRFSYEFIVPKDINYNFGFGKSSDYFYNSNNSAGGDNQLFYVGGIDTTGFDDNIGPEIEIFLNDESFVNGGLSDETPILKAELYDESGINTVGNGIGHNITVVLDEATENLIVLNDFYEADLDTYKSGKINYQLNELEPGRHTLTFKAWDVNNNSNTKTIEFIVQEKEEIALKHVLNYPNPFTTNTEFFFEHNQVCSSLETQIEIYTVSGILVRTINKEVHTEGFRTEGIQWNGKDEFGDQLAKGIYIYKVKVKSPDGKEASALQKLYLLR